MGIKIIGDYHIHSHHSDGKDSVDDVVKAASIRGLAEVAVTEHGSGKITGGLKPKNYVFLKELAEKAGKDNNIKTYFGVEANITGTNGQIDVREKDLDSLDILLCGAHRMVKPANIRSFFTFFVPNWFWSMLHWTPKRRIKKNTNVVKRAIEKNKIDVWAHPQRYFKLDVVEVAKTCAERGTLIELNGSRLSFRPIDFERMNAVGGKFIINSDAHLARHVGSVERVSEFLKLCDYKESDIVNLNPKFRWDKRNEVPPPKEEKVDNKTNKKQSRKKAKEKESNKKK